ncbi:MAG TPA: hypothetical protein VNN08_01175 [Thermoanaerobaculia bacterium]|nr:hypothetical protein [Thermoanaerobaculia bacterium]
MTFTAIAHPQSYRLQKRDALLFDSVGYVLLERNLRDLPLEVAKETEWLVEKGVVEDVAITIESEELPPGDSHKFRVDCAALYLVNETLRQIAEGSSTVEEGLSEDLYFENADSFAPLWKLDPREVAAIASASAKSILSRRSLSPEQLLEEAEVALKAGYDASARATALCLTRRGMADAIPILALNPIVEQPASTPLVPVVSIVLDALPSPDLSTPWEAIVDFRGDERAVQSLRRMRNWLRTFAAQDRSIGQIRQEVEHLVHEYQTYLELHKIEISRSRLEILLNLAGDAIDSLDHLKLGAPAKVPIDIRKHRMSLYEIEKAVPDREVAYLPDARRRLSEAAHD